jgi:hypothetical protein
VKNNGINKKDLSSGEVFFWPVLGSGRFFRKPHFVDDGDEEEFGHSGKSQAGDNGSS